MEQQTLQLPDRGAKNFRYNNGILRKLFNKSIALIHIPASDTFHIVTKKIITDPEQIGSSSSYQLLKGCISKNEIHISRETLEAIMQLGLQMLHDYPEQPKPNENETAENHS